MLISNNDQVLTKRVYNSDETVLWEGARQTGGGRNLDIDISLSEAITNFESVKVYLDGNYWREIIEINSNSTSDRNIVIIRAAAENATSSAYIGFKIEFTRSTNLNFRGGYTTSFFTAYTGKDWNYGSPVKVVGINRKEGN